MGAALRAEVPSFRKSIDMANSMRMGGRRALSPSSAPPKVVGDIHGGCGWITHNRMCEPQKRVSTHGLSDLEGFNATNDEFRAKSRENPLMILRHTRHQAGGDPVEPYGQ